MGNIDLSLDDAEFSRRLRQLEAEQERQEQFLPLAVTAWYDDHHRLVMVHLNNGLMLGLPVKYCQELSTLSDQELKQVEVGPGGYTLLWRDAGAGMEISSLLAGRFGSRKWMEQMREQHGIPLGMWADSQAARSEWGRVAGSAKSEAKAEAARANGRRGGRPRKVTVQNPDGTIVVHGANGEIIATQSTVKTKKSASRKAETA